MKKLIVAVLILLVVFAVACQPKAKVVPTPDMVESVPVQGGKVILKINNTNANINQTVDLENTSLEEINS